MLLNQGQGYIVVRLRLNVIAVVMLIALLVMAAPAQAASTDAGLHYALVVVEPSGSTFNVTVYYNSGFMTKVFCMLFGTGSLKSSIEGEVAGFGDIELQSLNTAEGIATFTAYNQSSYSDGWYMYDDNAQFSEPVDRLEIRSSTMDRPIVVENATGMPDFFYQ